MGNCFKKGRVVSMLPEDFTSRIETGDLLLFHGRNWWLSRALECLIPSKYSHSAILLKVVENDPIFGDTLKPGFYTLESGEEEFVDSENRRRKIGVQIVPLEKVWNDWDSSLWFRKLHCVRDSEFNKKFRRIHSEVHNLSYDFDPVDWFDAKFKITCCKNRQRRDTYWCSALCAYVYTKLGFADADTPWSLVTPRDLGTESGRKLIHFKNCVMDPEIVVRA